jgi:hypothetical protein
LNKGDNYRIIRKYVEIGDPKGHVVVQLVEAQHYKSEGHRFDSLWCDWKFSLTKSCWPHYDPEGDSASTETSIRNISWEAKVAGA